MKKYFALFLITFFIATQQIKAQLDLAFISSISVYSDNSLNQLSWTVANNRGATRFNVQRCINGKDFETIAVLKATEKFGSENYTYADTTTSPDKIMYRLEMITKAEHAFYSRIVMIQAKIPLNHNIKIIGNPVTDRLYFNYISKDEEQADIRIYNLLGRPVLNQKINSSKGNNFVTIPLNSCLAPGMYVIEIKNSFLSLTSTFIKL